MKSTCRQRFTLVAAIVIAPCILVPRTPAQDAGTGATAPSAAVDPFPAVYADPAVPLLQLPTKLRALRSSTSLSVDKDRSVDVLDVEGAGCVRHVWFVFGSQLDLKDVEIEISVDGAPKPQVRMPFRSFLGVLLGFEDYHSNSAGLVVFPNFTVTNDRYIPPKASPGWNRNPLAWAINCVVES